VLLNRAFAGGKPAQEFAEQLVRAAQP